MGVQAAFDGSLVGSIVKAEDGDVETSKAEQLKADYKFGRKELIGLCAVYAAIGTVNGFFNSYIQIPVCQYVFGFPSAQMCNAAPSIVQFPWSFKLFVGFFIDNFSFFGSRRKGWILFGWTLGLGMLIVNAFLVEGYVKDGNFQAYMYSLMGMVWCYIFSDVAVDALAVELTKFESDETRGKTLVMGNTTRFAFVMIGSAIGLVFMSGPSYHSPNSTGGIVFPFEISYSGMHWVLVAMALPSYLLMWLWLSDPPCLEEHPRGFKGLYHSVGRMWTAMKSYAFCMMVIQIFGIYAISGMQNPALSLVMSIAAPSNFVNSLGVVAGNIFLVCGIWIFKKYLMAVNWRFTLIWTNGLVGLCAIFNIMIIWNIWGAQNPWFYTVQNSVPSILQGMYFLLSQLATAEISPPGLEATYYEMMLSSSNGAIAMSVALQNTFVPTFKLGNITPDTWRDNHCAANNGTWSANPAPICETYQTRMSNATWATLVINLVGAVVFVWFLPKNAKQCREWQAKMSWRTTWAAVMNCLLYFGPWSYGMILLFQGTFGGN